MSILKHPRRVLAEAELLSSHFAEVEFEDNWVLVERFTLPSTFDRSTSKLLIILSEDYPESPPLSMYIEKGLKKNGKIPEHYFENKYGDSEIRRMGYAWYSIHFRSWRSSCVSIIQGDNLLTAANALYDALKYDEGER